MTSSAADTESCEDLRQRPLQLAKSLGLFKLGFAAQRRKNPLLILCYHGISKTDEHRWNPELYMPREIFRKRLERIHSAGYQVRSLDWALNASSSGSLKKPTVAITFDDGWHDFYSEAWPILREFDYPATIYQTSFYAKYNRPVFDVTVSYLLWCARGGVLADSQLTGSSQPLRLSSPAIRSEAAKLLIGRARKLGMNAEDKDICLRRLASALSIDYSRILRERVLHLMNSHEIATLSRAGIDIQLHTHTHRLPRERQHFLKEIDRNRAFLQSVTGKQARHFCYPNGWYRPEIGGWLKAAHIATATTCDPGFASSAENVYYLPRLTDSCCVSDVRFESWLSGVGLLGSWAKRCLRADSSWPSKSDAALAAMADDWSDEPDPEPLRVAGEFAARAAGGRV